MVAYYCGEHRDIPCLFFDINDPYDNYKKNSTGEGDNVPVARIEMNFVRMVIISQCYCITRLFLSLHISNCPMSFAQPPQSEQSVKSVAS